VSLNRAQGIENAEFMRCNALQMGFADASFDLVLAVESEMHMPDKGQFIRELVRTLKTRGVLLIASWNVRDTRDRPLSKSEAEHIRLLVDEWAHAKFISMSEYVEIFRKNGLCAVASDDWALPTQPSWRQAVLVAARNPDRIMNISMRQRWGLIRDAYTILRYEQAFRSGLCEYGMIRGQKAVK
jgi:MPBQ/MSBQ methyltransferase